MEKVLFFGPITRFFLSHLPISYLMPNLTILKKNLNLTILKKNLRVSQFIDNGQWDRHLLSSVVDVDIVNKICSIPLPLILQIDSCCWGPNANILG